MADKGSLGGCYQLGYAISWVLIFLGCWIYCIAEYGFLIGVGVGWLPSAIAATILALLWPLLAVGLLLLIAAISK